MTSPNLDVIDIDPHEADRLVSEGAILLDVREDDEWAAGRAPGAVHIPLGQVGDRHGELADGLVVCICRAGGRSATAAAQLAQAGRQVRNVAGGMQAWEAGGLPVVAADDSPGRVA